MMSKVIQYYLFDIISPAVCTTIYMIAIIVTISTMLGLGIAIVLYITSPVGLKPNPIINRCIGFIVNAGRSFPVIILIVALIPLVRKIIGTSIGTTAGIVYLTIASIPFVARVLEGNLREVDINLIKAAKSTGASDAQIIFHFIIHESIPSMVLGITFCSIIILGAVAAAGIIGAGGIGTVAMNYGYKTFNNFVMYTCVIIIALLVQSIQLLGNYIYRKLK